MEKKSMTTFDEVLSNLKEKLVKANYEEFTYRIPGETINIVPCSQKSMIFEEGDIDYYLVYSEIIHGGESLDIIADQIVNCEEIKSNFSKEEIKLRNYFDKYIDTDNPDYDSWDFYCDWHKDVYGFRPKGLICGTYVSNRNK